MRGHEIINGQAIRCYELPEDKRLINQDRFYVIFIDQPARAINHFQYMTRFTTGTIHFPLLAPSRAKARRIAFAALPADLRDRVNLRLSESEVTR